MIKCPKCDGFVDDVSIHYKLKHEGPKQLTSGRDTCHVKPCGCTVTRITNGGAFATMERLKGRKNAQKKKRQGKPGGRGKSR